MKKLLGLLLISPLMISEEMKDERLVSELTVDELREIVKVIVEETIEQCVVTGTMEGRAKVHLKVEGEVVAKMECELNKTKNNDSIKNKNL
jgi:hypothetical protein